MRTTISVFPNVDFGVENSARHVDDGARSRSVHLLVAVAQGYPRVHPQADSQDCQQNYGLRRVVPNIHNSEEVRR